MNIKQDKIETNVQIQIMFMCFLGGPRRRFKRWPLRGARLVDTRLSMATRTAEANTLYRMNSCCLDEGCMRRLIPQLLSAAVLLQEEMQHVLLAVFWPDPHTR